jgi:hypothetical protein
MGISVRCEGGSGGFRTCAASIDIAFSPAKTMVPVSSQ